MDELEQVVNKVIGSDVICVVGDFNAVAFNPMLMLFDEEEEQQQYKERKQEQKPQGKQK